MTLAEEARMHGLKYSTVRMRIKRGYSKEEALSMPIQIKSTGNYHELIGSECTTADGYKAKLLKINSWTQYIVGFEDGTTKTISAQQWRQEQFLKMSINRRTPQHSFNECVALYYLFQMGFSIPSHETMTQLGYTDNELFDAYNPELRIAFEYDGMGHTYKKDHKKNLIAQNAGIAIYRIREIRSTEPLNDGLSCNIPIKNTGWLSQDFREGLKELLSIISSRYSLPIPSVDFKKDRKGYRTLYSEFAKIKPTRQQIKRAEIKMLHHEERESRNAKIAEYIRLNPNITYPEIASRYGVSRHLVYLVRTQYGIRRYKKND